MRSDFHYNTSTARIDHNDSLLSLVNIANLQSYSRKINVGKYLLN